MEIIRVTEEWQKAAIYYVRAKAMCDGFGCSFDGEFSEDSSEHEYILAMDNGRPVSTCRIHYIDDNTGKIERVATLEEYRGKHFGQAVISEAERCIQEKGMTRVLINSREAVLVFYEKSGYIADFSRRSGSGDFCCVMMEKVLKKES